MFFDNDITMCLSETCPLAQSCYRKQAKPDKYQSYSDFTGWCVLHHEYEFYWPMDEEKGINDYE